MNFNQNPKAFFKKFPLREMNGHQKFLVVAVNRSRGKLDVELSTADIQSQWKKSLLGIKYNSVFYDRAQAEGWVNPLDKERGKFLVTKEGINHLSALSEVEDFDIKSGELRKSGKLIIVNRKGAHTFDKFLRGIVAGSKNYVLIADSWVNGDIFDTVLDVISKSTTIKLLYSNPIDNFAPREKRFSQEYSKFNSKKCKFLHDRFIIVDDIGYILGPSIKDAASKKPALIVALDKKETNLLKTFFQELWHKVK